MSAHMTRRTIAKTIGAMSGLALAGQVQPALGKSEGVSSRRQGATPVLGILAPAPGAVIATHEVELQLSVTNFELSGAKSGRPDEEGVGHIHVMVDGMSMAQLINFYATDTFSIPLAGLTPGPHTILVTLASNTHVDMMETAQQIEIDYQPTAEVRLPAAQDLGAPGLELVSPMDGAIVPAIFGIEVAPVNFNPTADLEGKTNIPGYGHWHVFVDTDMSAMGMMSMGMASPEAEMASPEAGMDHMAMMSMAGMVSMPGANTFDIDLSAWGPGTHVIWIEPVQNDHTQLAEFSHVEFSVTVQ